MESISHNQPHEIAGETMKIQKKMEKTTIHFLCNQIKCNASKQNIIRQYITQ